MNYLQLLDKVYYEGKKISSRGEETTELMGQDLEISKQHIYTWPEFRSIEFIKKYMLQEWVWYFSGDRKVGRIAESAGLWREIQNPDGTLNSNYGYLVFHSKVPHPSLGPVTKAPFEWALHALLNDKNTRQAVITYNTSGYNFEGNRDYICTQHQAFYIRQKKLECYIALRSSDLIFGLTYNMPWWSIVHQNLFLYLKDTYPDLKLGDIHVNIYSAHIYKRHYPLVEKMLKNKRKAEKWNVKCLMPMPIGCTRSYYEDAVYSHMELRKLK